MQNLTGTGVALITPFDQYEKIDHQGIENLVNHCVAGGVDYLVVMGTTGENPTLTVSEKVEMLQSVQRVNDSRLPIVYGIGGNNTAGLHQTINDTDFSDIDAILSVSPYYNKPTQEGLYQHYKTLSEAAPVPVIIYNVPGRTGSNITAETTLRLARNCKNIIGVKEASGDMEQIMQIIDQRPEGFLVISGEDNLTLPMMACGGEGVISVSVQGFPQVYSDMVRQALAGDFRAARKEHYKLFKITKMLFAEGSPGGIKAVLEEKGICQAYMRLPLWPISNGLRQNIIAEMAEQGI